MAHHCHATRCSVAVPPEMFVCKRHWHALPKPMRDAIWANYREGQCDDWQPSRAYCEAAKAAVTFLAKKDGVKPDTSVYDMFLASMEQAE